MAAAFSITIDTGALSRFGKSLGSFDSGDLGEQLRVALNDTGERTYTLSRNQILSGINLTEGYVMSRMMFEPAQSGKSLKAEIVAPFGRKYLTNLSHYAPQLVTQAVTWSNDRIGQEIVGRGKGKFGDWPNWTPRDGDAKRKIAAGQKAHTATVEVVRGARKSVGRKFTMPGKKDSEGNPLVFKREGSKIESLSGPSVYQLFRTAIPKITDRVADDLQSAVVRAAEDALNRALS